MPWAFMATSTTLLANAIANRAAHRPGRLGASAGPSRDELQAGDGAGVQRHEGGGEPRVVQAQALLDRWDARRPGGEDDAGDAEDGGHAGARPARQGRLPDRAR